MELNNEWALFNSKHSAELTEVVKNGEQQLDILADKIEKIKLKKFFQLQKEKRLAFMYIEK